MPVFRNTFLGGKMNKDADVRVLPPGQYRHAENIRVANSEDSDVGAIEKTLSNLQLTTLSLGANVTTLGGLEDTFEDKIYWAVKSDNGSYIIEYDALNSTTSFVLQDERAENVLDLNNKHRVQMVLFIDSDNGNRLLGFTDNNTQPKLVNVERAKTYGLDGFYLEQILLIKKPPLNAPILLLSNTLELENHIEERFITISSRYKYLDGEYSALSPQSEVAFDGKPFAYRFATGTNKSMLNAHNKITINFNTGSELVTDIELVYKESGSNNVYIIESFNKSEKQWGNDSVESFEFINNKRYKLLPSDELFRLYDNVPLKALAMAIINNRIVFGNYTENYNLLDCEGNSISTEFTLDKLQDPIQNGTATRSLKSNRGYEIALVYLDGFGRMTTPLTSETNTIRFNNNESVQKNRIKVIIPGKAPCFAKFYRFFIKESKQEYETLVPTLFFFEANFIYFYIQQADIDKVRANDFLIVKADTEQLLDEIVKLKVIEVERKEKDFISVDNGGQPEGYYMKTSIQNEDVIFDQNSYSFYEARHYDISENNDIINSEQTDYVSLVFKGDTLNDLSATSQFSTSVDLRYEIEIIDIDTVDKYRFRTQSVDGTFSNWDDNGGLGFDITGAAQALDADVDITFGDTTGHSTNDRWVVKVNKGFNADEDNHSYSCFTYPENITIGSIITLKYYSKKQQSSNIDEFILDLVSNANYDNLEEWYYGDEVYDQIAAETNFEQSLDQFWFRKANVTEGNFFGRITQYSEISDSGNNYILLIKSRSSSRDSSRRVYSDGYIEVRSLEQLPIFENEIASEDADLDLFYEIGRTYPIDDDGFHLGFDNNDISQTENNNAELELSIFNCISWGNGFESYKIRDEFNAKTMKMDSRPSTTIENYRQNIRIASFTYSRVYEQTTNYNALNEFNLSLSNFKDMDDKYGAIQKLVPWNTNLDIYQIDKVHKIYYDKAVIYNRDGSTNLVSTDNLLSEVVPYSGEFGISTNPESLTVYGNYTYWADRKRGVWLRKGNSGIEIISNYGMRDWFRDQFREGDTSVILSCYDTYSGQLVIMLNGYTLSYDEKVKGWTSFHSFLPDFMVKLNNRFYTVKNGQLYRHNEDNSYLEYYGQSFTAKVTSIFNQWHQEDSIIKTIIIEGDRAWKTLLKTNYTLGEIKSSEFNQRESRWFAHTRQNESPEDLRGISQGIGNIQSINGLSLSFNTISEVVSIGDVLFQYNNGLQEALGIIDIINRGNGTIVLSSLDNTPIASRFAYSRKNSRIEGADIRGFYLEATLEDNSTIANELFAISTNVVKSFI